MISYTFKKHKVTGEHHIFEGTFLPPGSDPICDIGAKSVCRKVDHEDADFVRLNCFKEQPAREAGAKLGRTLCGTCISHLYATPD